MLTHHGNHGVYNFLRDGRCGGIVEVNSLGRGHMRLLMSR